MSKEQIFDQEEHNIWSLPEQVNNAVWEASTREFLTSHRTH